MPAPSPKKAKAQVAVQKEQSAVETSQLEKVESPRRSAEEYPRPKLHLFTMTPFLDPFGACTAPAPAPPVAVSARQPSAEGGRWRLALGSKLAEAAVQARREARDEEARRMIASRAAKQLREADAKASTAAAPTTGQLVSTRIFVLLTPRIVRKAFDLCSEACGTLPRSSRVHIVQLRKTCDGAQRVLVVLVGQRAPLGWLTYRTARGVVTMRVEGGDDDGARPLPLGPIEAMPLPHSARSYSTPLLHMPSPGATPRRGGSPRSASPRPGSGGATPRPPGSARQQSPLGSARQPLGSARQCYSARSCSAGSCPSARARSSAQLLPAFHDSKFAMMQLQLEQAAAAASREPRRRRTSSKGDTFLKRMEQQKYANSKLNLWQRRLGIVIHNKKRWAAFKRSYLGVEAAEESSARSINLLGAAKKASAAFKMKSKVELLETAESFERKAAVESDLILQGAHKSLPVMLGEILREKNMKPNDLVQQWAKRGEEPISKMEFRTHIRKLLDNPDTRDIDALFDKLDDDGGGTLDVPEMRAALKKLKDAAIKAKVEETAMLERASHFTSRADAARGAVSAMEQLEAARRELEECKTGKMSLRDRMGVILADKGSKSTVNETVSQWDDDGDGVISMTEFRKHVAKLTGSVGTAAARPNGEIDQLFKELDDDGSGSMDTKEMRLALTALKEDGKRVADKPKRLKKKAESCAAEAKAAQIRLHNLLQEDKVREIEALERVRQEKAQKVAAEKAAREAKAAAMLAKMAEEDAKAAELEARINLKREADRQR